MISVRESIREERLKLCDLMDKCNGCKLPPHIDNVPNAATKRLQWCMQNCEVPGEMKLQTAKVEGLQRADRKARGVKPVHNVSVLFLEECK